MSLAGNAAGDAVAAWTTPLRRTENPFDKTLEVAYRAHAAADWSPPFNASAGEPVDFLGIQPVMAADGQASIAWVDSVYPETAVRLRQTS